MAKYSTECKLKVVQEYVYWGTETASVCDNKADEPMGVS